LAEAGLKSRKLADLATLAKSQVMGSPSAARLEGGIMGAGSRRGSRKTLSVIAAVACAAALCTAGVIYGASQGGNSSAALEQLAGSGVHKGSILNVEVPMQQLAGVQPGDIVKGKNGDLSWTGAVTKDSTLSPTQGCVTVRVISDKYIAPGTPVSGNVGGAAFMGTVVGSPNHQERIGSIERRIAALEPSAKGSVNALQRKLDRLKRTLRRMEGHKTIEERVEELSKRVIDLERRPVRPPRACGQADWMIPPLVSTSCRLTVPTFRSHPRTRLRFRATSQDFTSSGPSGNALEWLIASTRSTRALGRS
jgi:hypothetical protein